MTAPNAAEPAQAQSLDLHVCQHPMLANQQNHHRPKASISTYESTQCWGTSTGPQPRSPRMTAPNAGEPAPPAQVQSLDPHV